MVKPATFFKLIYSLFAADAALKKKSINQTFVFMVIPEKKVK